MRQPEPAKGQREVDLQAKEWMNEIFDEATVRGLETYGTKLETFNGRDANADGMEEIVDAIKYAA